MADTSDKVATCAGCTNGQRRFRGSTPRTWCLRFHRPAPGRCEDYRSTSGAIKAALAFVKLTKIK